MIKTDERVDEGNLTWISSCRRMDGWMDGCTDGWMAGWMVGWAVDK